MLNTKKIYVCALLMALPLATQAADFARCTAADGSYSYITRGPCKSPQDTRTEAAATKPLVPRDDRNTSRLIKCTSRDGKNVSIQRGKCANPDDYQQLLQSERPY